MTDDDFKPDIPVKPITVATNIKGCAGDEVPVDPPEAGHMFENVSDAAPGASPVLSRNHVNNTVDILTNLEP